MQELADSEGGQFSSVSQSFVGRLAEAALQQTSFDRVFLRGDNRHRRGQDVYVLADSSRLGQRPFRAWTRLALRWTLSDGHGAAAAEHVQKFTPQESRPRWPLVGSQKGWPKRRPPMGGKNVPHKSAETIRSSIAL